jgi:hypothetical protein
VELYFPVSQGERDALMSGQWGNAELAGLAAIGWETPGVVDDAIWLAADVAEPQRFEEADSPLLGYRSFVVPAVVLHRLTWRVVTAAEVDRALERERQGAQAARWRQRQPPG